MNIFLKSLASIAKIIVTLALIWFTLLLFWQKGWDGIIFGIVLFVFLTLPTIFVVYFKKNKFLLIYICIAWIILIFILGFGIYRFYDKTKTQKAIDFINSQKITLNDVMGKNLPPVPNQKLNDSTVAGIDANHNNIRDDVELAIFQKYPNSAKIRAAELQYAQALQSELTQVFNSDILVAAMKRDDKAYFCLGDSGTDNSLLATNEREKEINTMVLNIDLRKNIDKNIFEKFMTGYALPSGNGCDFDISSLPN